MSTPEAPDWVQAWGLLAQHSPQPMLLCDATHRVVRVNPAAERWLGPAQALLGSPLDTALPLCNPAPSGRTLLLEWSAVLAHWSGMDVDVCVRLSGGSDHWFRLMSQPLPAGGHALSLSDVDGYRRELERSRRSVRGWQALADTLNMHAIVSEADRAGTIVWVNRRFEAISGYSAQELIGSNHRIVNSGTHPPAFWADMWATVSQGLPWRGAVCNRAKDGSLYWVDSLIAPQLGPDGLVEKYTSIRTDITRYKQAEMGLAASRRMLARTGRLAGVGGWFQNGRRDTLYLSAECLAIYGLEAGDMDEAPGAPGYFAFPMDHPKMAAVVAHVQQLPPPFDTVVEIHSVRRGLRWLRILGQREVDDHGQSLLIGAVVDITAFTHAQRRVQESERTFRAAIDALGEAFALFDTQERLVFCNDRYRERYPGSAEVTPLGARYEDILRADGGSGAAPVGEGAFEDWVAERLRRFRSPSSDQIVQLSDGRWLHLADRKTADGFHVAFRIDITDTQRALREADAASRSKSQFLANMSHEIRTPMNAILGMLRLLEFTELSPRQGELVDKTTSAARSLLGILNDILDFSKIEAGKMTLDPEPFVVEAWCVELATILSGTLGGKALELVFDIDPLLPPVLVGDALRLKQVLINLLGNAIKFTSLGEVVLRLERLACDEHRARVRFEVQDSGIGIAAEQQRFIFTGFSQAEASTARQFGGTGLGLAIGQRLVGLMGGAIAVDSELGRGSRFGFEVELGVSALGTERRQAECHSAVRAPRVWLVGCHPRTREALVRGLGAQGCLVHTGDRAEDVPADLVVSDLSATPAQADALEAVLHSWHAAGHAPVWLRLGRGAEEAQAAEVQGRVQPHRDLIKPLTARGLLQAYRGARDDRSSASDRAAQPVEVPQRLRGLRLLLVEDNAFNQEVALEMLRREGATVDLADNGQAALAALTVPEGAAPSHDLVLMDMQMPVLDGLQATRAIRRLPRFADLPILAMTANAMPTDRQACLEAGMNAHIGKPFDLDEVVQVILVHTGRAPREAGRPPAAVPASAVPSVGLAPAVFAPEAALRRLGGDRGFFERLLRAYPGVWRQQAAELQAVQQAGDRAQAA
ncbi:ATP-binding protein, partial [Macromonas nakdongensis]|uniref:ATP-binding protein n=1 Tax=Macromonas nakdongensis TaxID=1843082 RepID=UPI0018E37242